MAAAMMSRATPWTRFSTSEPPYVLTRPQVALLNGSFTSLLVFDTLSVEKNVGFGLERCPHEPRCGRFRLLGCRERR